MKTSLTDSALAQPLHALGGADLRAPNRILSRAVAFAEPLLAQEYFFSGENVLAHANAVAAIAQTIGGSEAMQAAIYLVHASEHLTKPAEILGKAFGQDLADLALQTMQLLHVQRTTRSAYVVNQHISEPMAQTATARTESVRKMLLAFSRDVRVVILCLTSELQTLRYFAATKLPVPLELAQEALQIFAPLANRLGIWEIKWEMEDLSLRFLEPEIYKQVAQLLQEKRVEREASIEQLRAQLLTDLLVQGIAAKVQGRPKHIYSIVKKMRGKSLTFDQVYDIRALRIVVPSVSDCYTALSWVHEHFTPLPEEFDDYIARPKANGYQSLHTVVRDAVGKPIEIQIRTQAMHDYAEHGMAAHWAYKEAGTKGYAGNVSASGTYEAKIAVLRQLLAWERDITVQPGQVNLDDRIYVLTPDANIVELPQGASPVDFAYGVHTDLGHRCRGARVDGVMVPLNTSLKNGQTVEVIAVKEGGPSRDWLNPELGFLVSHRAKAKVRAWFNALAMKETVAKGREAVEKMLQREGKTAVKLEELASQLGFDRAEDLFEVVGKDEFSLRTIQLLFRPQQPDAVPHPLPFRKKTRLGSSTDKNSVLVVGMDALMTQLAACCKPAPPDKISGFVSRGKGVSVHRADCANLRNMLVRSPERFIDVAWSGALSAMQTLYPVDIVVEAMDRQGLLRDILEVLTKEKINVATVKTKTLKGSLRMTLTLELPDVARLTKVLANVTELPGVHFARRP